MDERHDLAQVNVMRLRAREHVDLEIDRGDDEYVYRRAHAGIMRRRREFAIPLVDAYLALWWVPAGHRPTVTEAEERLRHLRTHGPTAFAFGVRSPFRATAPPIRREDDVCRA